MSNNLTKLLSLILAFCLILEQSVFAQTIDLSHYFARNPDQTVLQSDKFRPLHLRYISYDSQANDFKILLDKGDFFNQKTEKPKNQKTSESLNSQTPELENTTQELMKYFFIGLSLPNEKFWVNLRPDSPDNILDPDLEKTDIGRIFLEADLQLKKDTSAMTSPQTKEGKEYWDKLYKKAGELFPAVGGSAFGGGSQNITIPTLTRPWIVPDEVIIRESPEGAYIYKATLKVMLEEDYLNQKTEKPKNPALPAGRQKTEIYNFSDPRLKKLNEYSTQLIKESIIPRLTREINSARRYAPLRQVYYSLILAQWFKQKYGSSGSARAPGIRAPVNSYIDLIDSGNLVNLTSTQPYDKQTYFQQYQKSFKDGEYNLQEPVYTPMGQSIRRYVSGGMQMDASSAIEGIPAKGEPSFAYASSAIDGYEFKEGKKPKLTGDLAVSSAIETNDNDLLTKKHPSATELAEDKKRLLRSLLTVNPSEPEFPYNQTCILALENFFNIIDAVVNELQEKMGIKHIDYSLGRAFVETLTYKEIIGKKGSAFFRYSGEFYEVVAQANKFKNMVIEKAKEYSKTKKEQIINIAVIGAGYGQEPISAAVYFREAMEEIFNQENGSDDYKGKIKLKIHVLDKPDTVYDKLKKNEIMYPEDVLTHSFGEYSRKIPVYFSEKQGGYTRSPELESMLYFHDVDLNAKDLSVSQDLKGDMDIVMFHNILLYLSDEGQKNVTRHLNGLLKTGGLLSIIANYSPQNDVLGRMLKNYSSLFHNYQRGQYYNGLYEKNDVSSPLISVDSSLRSASLLDKKGGIDLSRINKSIRTESVSSSAFGGGNSQVDVVFDLNEELAQLQKLLNAEIVPSADRLNRYARAACASSPSSPDSKDSALSLVAETFRLQENKAAPAAPELKALAAWLEQGT